MEPPVRGNGEASGAERKPSYSHQRSHIRHTSHQIQQLEAFFKQQPHPDQNQYQQLGRELGIEPRKVNFWFQNKRTQTKVQNEKAENRLLREQNDIIMYENYAIRESLKNTICPKCDGPKCDGPNLGEEERRKLNIQKLQQENAQLKQEYDKVASFICNYLGTDVTN